MAEMRGNAINVTKWVLQQLKSFNLIPSYDTEEQFLAEHNLSDYVLAPVIMAASKYVPSPRTWEFFIALWGSHT